MYRSKAALSDEVFAGVRVMRIVTSSLTSLSTRSTSVKSLSGFGTKSYGIK
ncbi:MAG TPA: hypothetical protein P5159_26090 [Phycisphaerae bacterium]|nr:hypothetical protein [Phycisphaerae bacterium]